MAKMAPGTRGWTVQRGHRLGKRRTADEIASVMMGLGALAHGIGLWRQGARERGSADAFREALGGMGMEMPEGVTNPMQMQALAGLQAGAAEQGSQAALYETMLRNRGMAPQQPADPPIPWPGQAGRGGGGGWGSAGAGGGRQPRSMSASDAILALKDLQEVQRADVIAKRDQEAAKEQEFRRNQAEAAWTQKRVSDVLMGQYHAKRDTEDEQQLYETFLSRYGSNPEFSRRLTASHAEYEGEHNVTPEAVARRVEASDKWLRDEAPRTQRELLDLQDRAMRPQSLKDVADAITQFQGLRLTGADEATLQQFRKLVNARIEQAGAEALAPPEIQVQALQMYHRQLTQLGQNQIRHAATRSNRENIGRPWLSDDVSGAAEFLSANPDKGGLVKLLDSVISEGDADLEEGVRNMLQGMGVDPADPDPATLKLIANYMLSHQKTGSRAQFRRRKE